MSILRIISILVITAAPVYAQQNSASVGREPPPSGARANSSAPDIGGSQSDVEKLLRTLQKEIDELSEKEGEVKEIKEAWDGISERVKQLGILYAQQEAACKQSKAKQKEMAEEGLEPIYRRDLDNNVRECDRRSSEFFNMISTVKTNAEKELIVVNKIKKGAEGIASAKEEKIRSREIYNEWINNNSNVKDATKKLNQFKNKHFSGAGS